jgi:hypothetical protein
MKVFEVLDQSEWENVRTPKDPNNPNQYWDLRRKRAMALKQQDHVLANKFIALEDNFPNEIKSRSVPDEHDEDSEYMDVPDEVEKNPEAWVTMKVPGAWLYDARHDEHYPDSYEEFYVLKTSPRLKQVESIINRMVQIQKLRDKLYLWPSTVLEK